MAQPVYRLVLSLRPVYSDSGEEVDAWDLLTLDGEEARIVFRSGMTRDLTARLWLRQIKGALEHRFVMQPGDVVDAITNAQEEALDLAQYLEKMRQEKSIVTGRCCHDDCAEQRKHESKEA